MVHSCSIDLASSTGAVAGVHLATSAKRAAIAATPSSTARTNAASTISSFEPNQRVVAASETPASAATSRCVSPSGPTRAMTASAPSTMRVLVGSAVAGTGTNVPVPTSRAQATSRRSAYTAASTASPIAIAVSTTAARPTDSGPPNSSSEFRSANGR